MKAKDMFEKLGYKYQYINNETNICDNVILYTHSKQDLSFQFNLFGQIVCMKIKNEFKDYDKVGLFLTKELIKAINQQVKELHWDNE